MEERGRARGFPLRPLRPLRGGGADFSSDDTSPERRVQCRGLRLVKLPTDCPAFRSGPGREARGGRDTCMQNTRLSTHANAGCPAACGCERVGSRKSWVIAQAPTVRSHFGKCLRVETSSAETCSRTAGRLSLRITRGVIGRPACHPAGYLLFRPRRRGQQGRADAKYVYSRGYSLSSTGFDDEFSVNASALGRLFCHRWN